MGSDLSLLEEGARNMKREKSRVSLMKLVCNWRYQYFQDRDQGKLAYLNLILGTPSNFAFLG